MTKLTIENISVKNKKIDMNDHMKKLLELMKKNNMDGMKMLPQSEWSEVQFVIKNSYSGFANAIRRILISELETYCLDLPADGYIKTDEEFIQGRTDALIKNINLLPINQEIIDLNKYKISLLKTNTTPEVIDVKASDIFITEKHSKIHLETLEHLKKASSAVISYDFKLSEEVIKKKEYKSDLDVKKILPDSNIRIASLRPGKTLHITDLFYNKGIAMDDCAKFSLLDNVSYKPINIKVFDYIKNEGLRSIEYNPTDFEIKFRTCANITVKRVISLLVERFNFLLDGIEKNILEYIKSPNKNYFANDVIEVNIIEDEKKEKIFIYKIKEQYFTSINAIAQKCYLLDESIPFCTGGVERYDTKVGVLKLKHAEPNKLILDAVKDIRKEIDIFSKAF
jgi:hypothetical protein